MSLCPYCKSEINPGQTFVICPKCTTMHHVTCWQANELRCTVHGCDGRGEMPIHKIGTGQSLDDAVSRDTKPNRRIYVPTQQKPPSKQIWTSISTHSKPPRSVGPPPTYVKSAGVVANKSPFLAALLSFLLFGGVGQIYLGQTKKGVVLIIAAILTSCTGLGFIVNLAGTIDAYSIATKLNQGLSVKEWEFGFSWKAAIVAVAVMGAIVICVLAINS